MTYPFVPAYYDNYGLRTRPALAFVVHMAEGGGTVGYLSRANPNGVSVHYVIERGGRIVQMLRENRISGSIRASDLRKTNDLPFRSPDGAWVTYGYDAAKAALGQWWYDPNTVVLSCEIEGFAAVGPSDEQADALARLVADVRSRYPRIHILGHRDFTSRKACPGKLIPWGRIGRGAGLPDTSTEEPLSYAQKFERWTLDGGPGKVTTFGAPYKLPLPAPPAEPEVDWSFRLALTSGRGDINRRLQPIARSRLTDQDESLNETFYRMLARYEVPEADCQPLIDAATAPLKATISAKNTALRAIASEAAAAAE